MKRPSFPIILLTFFSIGKAQNLPLADGTLSRSMAGVRVAPNDAWAAYNQPCNMLQAGSMQFGMHYTSPFRLQALQTASIAVVKKLKTTAIGFHSYRSGYHVSNHWVSTISSAKKLKDNFDLAISVSYSSFRLPALEEKNRQQLLASIFCRVELSNEVELHMTICDPAGSLQTQFLGAMRYRITPESDLYLQLLYVALHRTSVTAGLRHTVSKKISLTLGVNSTPTTLAFGVKITLNKQCISTASSRHSLLGFPPSVSLEWASE